MRFPDKAYYKRSLKTTGYILTLAVITTFDWLNNVANLRHNAFATSASSNKSAFVFYLFESLFAP